MRDELAHGSLRWWRRAAAVLSVLVALMFAAVMGWLPQHSPSVPPVTVGVLPPWDAERAIAELDRYADRLGQVAPWWYRPTSSGELGIVGDPAQLDEIVRVARHHDRKVVPIVANFGDDWDAELVGTLLADPRSAAIHVAALTELVVEQGYDGIHLDYRQLASADADRYAELVHRVAEALAAHDKLLAVSVHPKTHADEPGWGAGHDYARLGAQVDQLHVLTLDHRGRAPGPLAPIGWVDEVAGYASSVVPADRLFLGIGVYGRLWSADGVRTLTLRQVAEHRRTAPGEVGFDPSSASPFLEDPDERSQLWFEDEASLRRKLVVADRHDVGGVLLWRLGGTVPGVWDVVDDEFGRIAG